MLIRISFRHFITSTILLLINFQILAQLQSQKVLQRKSIADSLIVLNNENNLLPFANLNLTMASLSIGVDTITTFEQRLADYNKIENFIIKERLSEPDFNLLIKNLKKYDIVICSLHNLNNNQQLSIGIKKQMTDLVRFLSDSVKSVIVLFGDKTCLSQLKGIEKAPVVLLANEESIDAEDFTAQLLFGGIGAKGKLSSSINEFFKQGDGIETLGGIRFQYCLPEELGLDSKFIETKVDSIAQRGIKERAFPGCQVIAAKDGKIFFQQTYGFQTYDSFLPVKNTNIYDYASVTKISGALPCLMKLYDEGKFKLDTPFYTYWPQFKHSNKKELVVRDVLTHQARLVPGLSLWKYTLKKNGKFKHHVIRHHASRKYPTKISDNMYLHKNYEKVI